MGCQFWLNEDGELIADDSGAIALSEDCPCSKDCCEKLAKRIASLLRQTVQYCVPCDQLSWNENCGECEIVPPNQDPENPLTQLGEYVTKRRNRIISFYWDTGFQIKQPEGGGQANPQEGEIVTVTFCDGYEATTVYSSIPSLTCYTEEPCCIFTHVYCPQGGENRKLYPVINAPDYPSIFSNAQEICQQKYWKSCFQTTPVAYVTCAAQVIAPRCWFDDYVQGSAPEPDYTPVWGVIGCFCEGNDKWELKAVQGYGTGLIVVNTPFEPEMTDKLDEQGNPVLDEHGNTIPVIKCAITCDGSKAMVKEMIQHYQGHNPDNEKSGFRITTDMNKWQEWTGEVRHDECFFGFIPVPFITFYECYHYNANNVLTRYHHIIMFDCDCNLMEDELVWDGSAFDTRNVDIYPSDADVCNMVCPALWAMVAYAEGTEMEHSAFSSTSDGNVDPANPDWSIWPPRTSGEGGVIISEDSRASGQGIYSIGGSPCIFAAWDSEIMIWVGCECDAHVECMRNGQPKKFIRSVDPCICVDFREIVDTYPSLFGVIDKQWGSHSIVHWEHTTPVNNYTGPYWEYTTSVNHSHTCSKCDTDGETITVYWYSAFDPYIDYNMLVVIRVVNGEYEVGHVNKEGGISNWRLQANGVSQAGVITASFGFTNDRGEHQDYAYICGPEPVTSCKVGGRGGLIGWYYVGRGFKAYAGHGTSPDLCPCEGDMSNYPPYCRDHSIELNIDWMYFYGNQERNILANACLTPAQFGYLKGHREGKYAYVRNETTCESSCLYWDPGWPTWSFFLVEFIRTSCGLLITSGAGQDAFLDIIEPPLAKDIIDKFSSKVPYLLGYDVVDGYPYDNDQWSELYYSGARWNTVRNSRGTLISYTGTNIPVDNPPYQHGAQSPLCHREKCAESSIPKYSDMYAYCRANPRVNACLCMSGNNSDNCLDTEE